MARRGGCWSARFAVALGLVGSWGCSRCEEPPPPEVRAAPVAPLRAARPVEDAGVDAGRDAGRDAGAEARDAGTDADRPRAARHRVRAHAGDRFFEQADAPLRQTLSGEDVAVVERGTGGRSLAFRITLADGTRGYFKPEQSFTGTRWYAEIAAYHLDRELGLGRVAPVVGRAFQWSALEGAAGDDPRIRELRIAEDGTLRGAFIAWVSERLFPLELPSGWERWLRVEGEPDVVSPFQRPGEYRRGRAGAAAREGEGGLEPDLPSRPAELSDMMVFDYLAHNVDRWGGNNTNVRTIGRGGPLMFLDNAASFTLPSARVAQMDARLRAVQRFRRSTLEAVRRFDPERFFERLARDPLAPELDERQRRNLEARRAHLLAHVERLVEQHGEDAVLPW